MSGGGGFGGMDNLGNMGSFGGRMAGKFFIWKTINIVRRRPSQNKQKCTDLPECDFEIAAL